jgi:MFS family permease
MVSYVALPFQMKELTQSYVAVGLLGVVGIVPLVVFGLYGGALADYFDRKKLLIWTELAFMVVLITLVINSLSPNPSIVLIYLCTILLAAINGLQRPAMDAMLPRVVPTQQLAAASALTGLSRNFSMLLGTTIGGLLVVALGVASAYLIDAVSFALAALIFIAMKPIRVSEKTTPPSLSSILEGARYAAKRPDLIGTYLVDTAAMVFAFPNALFPFLADEYQAPNALGLLYAAGSLGALLASATSRWTNSVTRHGRAVVFSASVWGFGIALAGTTNSMWFALLSIMIAGAADMISGIFRSLIWNTTIPDSYRGRLAGIEVLSYSIGPQVGQIQTSFVAANFGIQRALISGGVLCMSTVAICARAIPSLWNYNSKSINQSS